MPKDHLKNHSLVEIFEHQISRNELDVELKKVLSLFQNGTKSFFSISFPIQKVDTLAVLEQNPDKASFEYYWEKPTDVFSIAAAGELRRIRTTGGNRFKEASAKGKKLISKIYLFTKLKHSKTAPHLFGGFRFMITM